MALRYSDPRGTKRSRSPSRSPDSGSARDWQPSGAHDAPDGKQPRVAYDMSADESQPDVGRSSPFPGGDGGYSSLPDDASDTEQKPRSTFLEADDPDQPSIQCLWQNCGRRYTELHGLIGHLHQDHIGTHKKRYTCEWVGCSRKSRTQTSRFALLSHLRSHTGEKPFTCPLVDCDKSFTRSDALAKHMRAQHQMVPLATRRAKPRRSLRRPGEQGSDSEDEAVEMVTLSDYEPLEKSPVIVPAGMLGRKFSDSALGITRDPLGSDGEEKEIRQVRHKAAELMYDQHGIGTGSILDNNDDQQSQGDQPETSSSEDAENSAGGDETEDEPMNFDLQSVRRPAPLDLINNSNGGAVRGAKTKNGTSKPDSNTRSREKRRGSQDYKKRYLIAKAKLRFLQAEHQELVRELHQLREDYEGMQEYKSDELNAVLMLELGDDVEAIFSPAGTPPPMQSYTELRGHPPIGY